MIEPKFRQQYSGEFVIVESRWKNGKKDQIREWVPNPIENQHISGRAACIVSDVDRHHFDYTCLQTHRGGLLSSKRLQTYGIGSITKHMNLNFAIETNQEALDEIKSRNYQEKNIVYTTTRLCLRNPGDYYLIPYNPLMSCESLTLYLAAFDGHREIFMLGFNNDTPTGNKDWIQQVNSIMKVYFTCTFVLVGIKANIPKIWFNNPNVKHFTFQEFISYCDV